MNILMYQFKDRSLFLSRFLSRWPGKIYVYTDNAVAVSQGSQPRRRITSKKGQPANLRWSKTLHLEKLPIGTKLGIISGRIQWLFVTHADSRSSTESDDVSRTGRRLCDLYHVRFVGAFAVLSRILSCLSFRVHLYGVSLKVFSILVSFSMYQT